MERKLLLLLNDESVKTLKEVLKSPLELSLKLIIDFIENRLDEIKGRLDDIKRFAAGIESAERKGDGYIVSDMYPYYFAFHQFVHSSFRARQGKVLEEIIKNILAKEKNIFILNKTEQEKEFDTKKKSLPDYDVFLKTNDKLVIIQIRSRDDTGGTTAKTSLVEGVKYIEEFYKGDIHNIEYITFIWEGLGEQQQGTTKEKFYDYLKDKTSLNKEEFFYKLVSKEGVEFRFGKNRLNLYLVYGQDNFMNLLSEKINLSTKIKANLANLVAMAADWDDFWMAYQYVGLEYERLKIFGFSYIFLIIDFLKKTLQEREIYNASSMEDFLRIASNIASEILKEEIKLPFEVGKYNFIYFRDLVLLILIYYKKKTLRNRYLIIPKYISFREIYPDISTKYATHKIYYYPAAFIPQVIRFVLDNYTKPKDIVLDMFAGGGTVGVESFIKGRRSILIDINPLLPEIIEIKTFIDLIKTDKLYDDINKILYTSKKFFNPDWKNINHWYNEKILTILKNLWGNFYYYRENLNYPNIIKFALLYISRLFSYSDDGIPKLYKSKKKTKKIDELVKKVKMKDIIIEKFKERVFFIKKSIDELRNIVNSDDYFIPQSIVFDSYTLSSNFKDVLSSDIDCIITSPPYLQAQEYIRSIKLDLYWSKFNDNDIRNLSKKEIPYRKLPENYSIDIEILNKIKNDINFSSLEKKDREIFDSYFYYTINTIYNYSKSLKKYGKLCIFVGSPSFKGFPISIWEIFVEFFTNNGFSLIEVFADPIVSRKLANNRNNNNPNGMEYEYLIVLRKELDSNN